MVLVETVVTGFCDEFPILAKNACIRLMTTIAVAIFFFIFAMVKAITPRYRYDQLMRLGWKVFLPMSLAWVVIVAFLAKFEAFGGAYARWAIGG